jgi:hypothetical protein
MSDAPAGLPLRRIWRGFAIVWIFVIAGLASWNAFVASRAHPFTKSYVLGEDVVDETHELRWLAWGGYGVRITTPGDVASGNCGGDVAVEVRDEAGDTIVPRKFLFRDHPSAARWTSNPNSSHHILDADGFTPSPFERLEIRVSTIKTGNGPPCKIEVAVDGADAWAAGETWFWGALITGVVIGLSAILLAILIWIVGRPPRARSEPSPDS